MLQACSMTALVVWTAFVAWSWLWWRSFHIDLIDNVAAPPATLVVSG
jgi:hypothetical protein